MSLDIVDALLERAGLELTDEDRQRLARIYPAIAEQNNALRDVEVREAEPAAIYEATSARYLHS